MKFNNLDEIIASDQIITCDKIQNEISKFENVIYFKRDFLFRSGSWRNQIVTPLIKNIDNAKNKCLVVGHSDIKTHRYQSLILKSFRIKHVFGVNVLPSKTFSSVIPLGITNDCDDSNLHRILGNINHFNSANNCDFETRYESTIYCNYNVSTNKERIYISKLLENKKGVVFKKSEITDTGRINYLIDLRKNNFVICPPGNGVDTHRLWETLYMGGIPVVKSNPIMLEFAKLLPIIVVKKWSEVLDSGYMEKRFHEITFEKVFKFETLGRRYWMEKILREADK